MVIRSLSAKKNQYSGNISSRFFRISEANSSEFLKNLEELFSRYMYYQQVVILTTHWLTIKCCEKGKYG